MKLEFVDIGVALTALLMLGAFAVLGNATFLYVFFILVATEIIGMFMSRKKLESA